MLHKKTNKLPPSLMEFILYFLLPLKYNFLCLLFLTAIIGVIIPLDGYVTKYFIDKITSQKIVQEDIFHFVLIFVLWWEGFSIAYRTQDYFKIRIFPKLKVNIISYLISYIIQHSHKFFQEKYAGSISNNISEMSRAVGSIIELLVEQIFRQFIMLISAIILLYYTNPIFAFILCAWFIIFMSINTYFMRYVEAYSNILAVSKSTTIGKVVDIINNIINIKVFSRRDFEINNLQKSLDVTKQNDVNLRKFQFKIYYLKGLINNLLIGFMIYALCILYMDNKITLGDFSLIFIICSTFAHEVWNLVQYINSFTEELGICKQSLTLIMQSHEIVDKADAKVLHVSKGNIFFDKVTFKYNSDAELFNNLSLVIKSGTKIGLVGYSGGGKTSFVNLIIRLFEVNSGRIIIDNQDISLVTQESLRDNIAFIPQDPILFHRTLIENIRYGKINATDDEVIQAAKLAHAHEFIITTQQGYNTLVGERGIKLSGGQRQRIVIARAILKNAPIVILDEATSALDSMTESLVQDSLKILMQDKTSLVIAHRLSTLLHMDRILVFENGNIIQDGGHFELLQQEGLYRQLWHSQINGFIIADKDGVIE